MAIINHSFGFIFVHIPKCGGTTVSHALEPLCSYRDIQLGGTPFGEQMHRAFQPRYGIGKHSFAVELRRAVGLETWTRYTTFSVVRDPVERTVSTYRYLKQHEEHYSFMRDIDSFPAFLQSEQWSGPGPDRMFEPQFRWLHEERDPRQRMVDCFIPAAKLGAALPEMLLRAGVPETKVARVAVERWNASKDDIEAEITDEALAMIRTRYERDFDIIEAAG